MQIFKQIVGGLLTAGIFFLLFLLAFENKIHLPPWLQVAGRMHPMFLHFPITLLLVYFVVFWIPASQSSTQWVLVIGFLAAFSAVITAIMGLMLAMQENFDGITFQRHKWGGVFVALTACLFYYLHNYFVRKKSIARPLTIFAAVLILVTGHWGGNLTHGEGYLLQPYAKEKKMPPLSQAIAFDDIIQPVLQSKCGSCHSNGNTKGGLSVSDSAGMAQGGKTGPFFVPGQPGKSLFIQRVLLPLSDKKHMAPSSKPQLTDEEIQLLNAWVRAGAPISKKVIDLPAQDSFRLLTSRLLVPDEAPGQTAYTFPAADEKTIRSLNNNYRVVSQQDRQSPALEVQFYGSKMFTTKSLEDLLPVKQQITDLNLAKMPLKDDALKVVAQMPNLERLNINYTEISDTGIMHLTKLKNLKEVTLSATRVTATGLEQMLKMPSMNAVYVWNTKIESNKIAALQHRYKNATIETGYVDDGRDKLPLNPPVAETVPAVYEAGTRVSLRHPLRGVEIRYTVNGAEPDSINSPVYQEPITLDTFMIIRAKAYKAKWYGSKTLKAIYFTKGVKPDSILIHSPEKENIAKAKLLSDLETGDQNLGSGKWIGIRKPATCYVFFDAPQRVEDVTLNMFINTRDKIYLPAKMELWGGEDTLHLKLLATWTGQKPPPEEKPKKEKKTKPTPEEIKKEEALKKARDAKEIGPDLVQPVLRFASTQAKCLKLVLTPWEINKVDVQTFLSEMVIK